jgi:hypothetical protein
MGIDRVKLSISKDEFASMFPSDAKAYYDEFISELNTKFSTVIHPSAHVQNLKNGSIWMDSGGNSHITLRGEIFFLGESGELGGKFVWLKNLKKFRGKAWSSLSIGSDTYLVAKAREHFREARFREAWELLNAIQDIDCLTRSSRQLKELVERRL